MNCADRVSSSLAFVWLSFICGVTGSLNCSFKDGFCDWNQTSNQCSWILANNGCPYKVQGCVYFTDKSGPNCSIAGLTAETGHSQNRGIYFQYFMTVLGEGSLEVKDDAGEVLWSCTHLQGPPSWKTAQVLLQPGHYTKAITIEAHIEPGSPKYIAVKIVQEAERMKATPSCPSYTVDGTTSAIRTTSGLSTIHDSSDRSSIAASPETTADSIGTENHLTISTIEASQTTSRPEEKTLTHAQTEMNQLTETQSTTPCETDESTGSGESSSVEPVTGSTDSPVEIFHLISVLLHVLFAGCIILFLVSLIDAILRCRRIHRMNKLRRNIMNLLKRDGLVGSGDSSMNVSDAISASFIASIVAFVIASLKRKRKRDIGATRKVMEDESERKRDTEIESERGEIRKEGGEESER